MRAIKEVIAREFKGRSRKALRALAALNTIKNAYIVKPINQAKCADAKYLWLTRTSLMDGMPGIYEKNSYPELLDGLTDHLYKSIAQNMHYQFGPLPRSKAELFAFGMLQDIMRVLWSSNQHTEGGHPYMSKASLAYRPSVAAYWVRDYQIFQVEDHPTFVFRCKYPLSQFAPPIEKSFQSPSYMPFADLGLLKKHIHLSNFPGYKSGNPMPYIHTQILVDRKSRNREQILAHGIIAAFAQLMSHAVLKGSQLDNGLRYPLSCQSIITNGQQFTFMCYQLNTLILNTNETARANMVWASETMDLFYKHDDELIINTDCLKYFIHFFNNKPLRFKEIKRARERTHGTHTSELQSARAVAI